MSKFQQKDHFTRDMMSNTLPKLPPSSLPKATNERKQAWGTSKDKLQPVDTSMEAGGEDDDDEGPEESSPAQRTNPLNPLQAETMISAGLMRVVDQLARKVLPWQAVLCPKAVESIYDLRMSLVQQRHNQFIIQMKQKLEEKVNNFLKRKEEEVDAWLKIETEKWQAFLAQDEVDLFDYLKADIKRLTDRALFQDAAYRIRELRMANELDDHERDQTRDQLTKFRRVVRASKQGQVVSKSLFEQEERSVEVQVLQDSIAKGQTSASKKVHTHARAMIRKHEETHDWLCSLADNAITAAISEEKLKELYAQLDGEKGNSMGSLHTALGTYKEQHTAILEAIVVFAGRIHQHASDYLQREQLVLRGFMSYLLGVISGEIKSHTADQKKSSYAWETKSLIDRGQRKEQHLLNEFHQHMDPLDRMVVEFKEKMKIQLDHITMKLQSILNGKENDINSRKSSIHKKLARHVNKACNARRQRLKDSTQIRRDEFALESMAITKVDELCGDLRNAIDVIWVKEHLKERKIYEASLGRLERMEKSALIIWNKHSHLTVDQKEEYHDWLMTYKQDRDGKIAMRKSQIERDYSNWRKEFGVGMKDLSVKIRSQFKALIPASYDFNIDDSLEDNLAVIRHRFDQQHDGSMAMFHQLKLQLEHYLNQEVQHIDEQRHAYHDNLLQEWREHLFRLDSAINRRIGGLKDMEADLEETIRLTILQHEIENSIFEQLSCSRMEGFWIDWRKKMKELVRDLVYKQEDYEVAKRNGKSKQRLNKTDRVLDDLIDTAKETKTSTASKQTLPPPSSSSAKGDNDVLLGYDSHMASDTMRLKIILEEIKPDIYRDFSHKLTRGIERLRRDLGEGKRQYVPSYAMAKVIALNCERFYEKAQLNEKCIGRISFQGVLLFQEGLPMFAKSTFVLATTLSMLSFISANRLHGADYKIDGEEILNMMENMKVFFMVGLLTITSQYGDFGEYSMRSECLWMCSVLGISPPVDLLQQSLAKGLKESVPHAYVPSGVFSEDTVDLYNTLIELATDLEAVNRAQEAYEEELRQDQLAREAAANIARGKTPGGRLDDDDFRSDAGSVRSHSTFRSQTKAKDGYNFDNDSVSFTEDPSRLQAYNKTPNDIYKTLQAAKIPLVPQLEKLRSLLPMRDCFIFSAFLGRPEGTFDMTTHSICQVVSIWRRTCVSIMQLTMSPPSSEFPRIQDIITAHQASITGSKRMGYGNINCVSPYQTISTTIDYMTSIQGLPISVLQALELLAKGGSVDPWLEDPKQSSRHERVIYEIQELLQLLSYRIPKSMIHDEYLLLVLPKNIEEILKKLDLNFSGNLPLEIVRTYLQRDDMSLTNTQISMIYWSLCRVNEDFDDIPTSLQPNHDQFHETTSQALVPGNTNASVTTSLANTFQSGGGYRPIVATQFSADPEEYMLRFGNDVDRYLHSMPTIDTNVVLGYLPNPLSSAAAHQLVTDAMKLDPSARNPMPSSCCIWLGQRMIQLKDALSALKVPGKLSKDGNYIIGLSEKAFSVQHLTANINPAAGNVNGKAPSNNVTMEGFVHKLRTFVEVDMLSKYPEICELYASDRHYGPAGNDPMQPGRHDGEDFHWKELLQRRIHRLDRLLISWRDLMLSEWASSLYASRQMRFQQRVSLVQKSVSVYHTQYHALREVILSERGGFMSLFRGLENELIASVQDDYSLITYHTSYIDRALRRFEGEYDRFWTVVRDMLVHFINHASSIKRFGIQRIDEAGYHLQQALEESCTGLIVGYTTGYAQTYFDNLLLRSQIWRERLTDLQGQLIVMKEKFMAQKDDLDRDMTLQISDRLTVNRTRCKDHLDQLTNDSYIMLDTIANARSSYANLQKDANARLILRIEKAIRESRKLRGAAENEPQLEEAVLRDIRQVLNAAKFQCVDIMNQIRSQCQQQLQTVIPIRKKHRENMDKRIKVIESLWKEVENVVYPLVADYEYEVMKQLHYLHAMALEYIHKYREGECLMIQKQHKEERKALVLAFRKHFREYDLHEASIFERFDAEVNQTVQEMVTLWGPSRPKFIKHALKELESIATESLLSSQQDIHQQMFVRDINDDFTNSRYEIADVFSFNLMKSYEYAKSLSTRYVKEKEEQIIFIEDMSMQKNGDTIRPQVKAVLDLLISGIEIDNDFNVGYENLVIATGSKAKDSEVELQDFVQRYSDVVYPVSISHTATLTKQRIQSRKDEVDALLQASYGHVAADHSKLEVLYNAGEKDIEEWFSLTSQLIENAFHNAELNYLSNLWPTPEATPRLELLPEDEDRVGKLKALLAETQKDVRAPRSNAMVPFDRNDSYLSLATSNMSSPQHNMASYKGDANLLLRNLAATEEEEEEARQKKLQKREQRRREKELLAAQLQAEADPEKPVVMTHLPDGIMVPELRTREVQQGWFECVAPEGYTYFHNPETDESLWDLPQALKKPLHDDSDLDAVNGKKPDPHKLIETPRELLMLEAANMYGTETMPIRIVPEEFRIKVKIDPKVVMSEVAEEARAISAFVTDTALDITELIHGRRGRDEKTIATLLGDRYNPDFLKKKFKLDVDSDAEDDEQLRKYRGEETQAEEEDPDEIKLNYKGRVLMSDNGANEIDPELNQMLQDLGIGVAKDEFGNPLFALEDENPVSKAEAIVKPDDWLHLGLGGPTRGDNEQDSSDGEEYTGFEKEQQQRKQALKYEQQLEIDLMMKEDDLSIAVENMLENDLCQDFLGRLTNMLESETCTEEMKADLQELSKKIKPMNLYDIMNELEANWELLDDLIVETKRREGIEERRQEEMKTEEGKKRQQMILDHAEDIQEMATFLYANHLSKVAAKRVATELIIRQIATPKKLAKVWQRQEINLKIDLQIDEDDAEDLEQVLASMVMNHNSVSSADLHALASNNNSYYNNNQNYPAAGYSPFVSHPQYTDPNQASYYDNTGYDQSAYEAQPSAYDASYDAGYDPNAGYDPHGYAGGHDNTFYDNSQYDPNYYDPNAAATDANQGYDAATASTLPRTASIRFDPGMVTVIEDDYNDDDEEAKPAQQPSFAITKEGYKSFRGGWIESTTENNEPYFYNLKTGASAWNLPELIEHEAEDPVQSIYDQPQAVVPYQGADQYNQDPYYDPNNYPQEEEYPQDVPYDLPVPYKSDGTWKISDALGIEHPWDYKPPPKPRAIPTYQTLEVGAYAKREGVARQLVLLQTQDRWQNALVKAQHFITEQKSQYLSKRVEMFDKISERVESRLNAFIEDIKFMQKTLKKELGEANATERDLRRLFEEDNANTVRAEKLSFILESLEKFKVNVSQKYDSAFKQIDKFAADWEMLKMELLQIGDIFDEGIAANLEQCRLACEHVAKMFAYDQFKQNAHVGKLEKKIFRISLRKQMITDTLPAQQARQKKRHQQLKYYVEREKQKEAVKRELRTVDKYLEEELVNRGFPPIDPMEDQLTEEELCMSFMLSHLEMEHSLVDDYDSILEATQNMVQELQGNIQEFDTLEKSVSSLFESIPITFCLYPLLTFFVVALLIECQRRWFLVQ